MSGSLWFLPGLIALGAAVLAALMIDISTRVDDDLLSRYPRIFGASADGSRSMLSTIAGSMITVAGVTFSILVVAVSQASTQFTPRVLRNLMRDRHSQVALGVLTGVFVYCLVVIRTIRGEEQEAFIPSLAVLGAFVLAVVAIGFLMYFIHHIASTLEPGEVLQAVYQDTKAAIDRLFPEQLAEGAPIEDAVVRGENLVWRPVPARCIGYIQHVDAERLLTFAMEHDCVLRMERAIGEFVFEGAPLVAIAGVAADDDVVEELNGLFVVDSYRTVYQDVEFGVRQIVDVALKALSPGINDPTTAASCIHYLTGCLVRLAGRAIPARARTCEGELRVIACGPTFDSIVELAFSELRRTAASNARVLAEVVMAIQQVAAATQNAERRRTLALQLDSLEESAAEALDFESDQALIRAACSRCREVVTRD